MSVISKIRDNDYYKYGIELPALFSLAANFVTDNPFTCVAPVTIAAISAYAANKENTTAVSRLFNLAAGVIVGTALGVAIDNVAEAQQMTSYLSGVIGDTLTAFGIYATTRYAHKGSAGPNMQA